MAPPQKATDAQIRKALYDSGSRRDKAAKKLEITVDCLYKRLAKMSEVPPSPARKDRRTAGRKKHGVAKMSKSTKSDDEIREKLANCGGDRRLTAVKLGMTYAALCARVASDPVAYEMAVDVGRVTDITIRDAQGPTSEQSSMPAAFIQGVHGALDEGFTTMWLIRNAPRWILAVSATRDAALRDDMVREGSPRLRDAIEELRRSLVEIAERTTKAMPDG